MALTKISRSLLDTGVSDSSDATAITIDSNENVGIGETSPDLKLHIKSSGQIAKLETTASTGDCILTFADAAANKAFVGFGSSSSELFQISNVENGDMKFDTNNTERMRITSAGNVGIGASSPNYPLTIHDTGDGIKFEISDLVDANYRIQVSGNDILTGPSTGSDLIFQTLNTERIRIDASGRFLFGTTDTSFSSGPGFKLNPSATFPQSGMVVNTSNGTSSNFHLYNTNASFNGFRWYVNTNGGTINYSGNNVNLSDERLKTNIELSGNYLEKICNIPVKLFNYKDEPEDKDRSLGVIAQDVEAVAPELVNNDGFGDTPEDGVPLKTVYTTDMMYALMKAIQELSAKVEELESKINE